MQNSSSDIDAIRQVVNQVLEVHAREEGGQRSQARSEILIHSMQVFAQRGLQRTTVQHLLDASDVSRRTFYKYFRNKMDVLESIYRIFVDNMLLHFHKEVKQASSARDIIRNTTQVYFDYHVSMGPIIKLMMEEARSSASALAPHRVRAQDIASEVLTAQISRYTGKDYEPLVFRTMLWMLENYSLYIFEDGGFSQQRLDLCKKVAIGIAESLVLGEVTPGMLERTPS
ncbi:MULTISPECIES: TetR/AcrR family transcriptional regulator [unclassified Alcanivorax]|uniref:TetR/AcrR family transcriptional regulator n=1 Tax=unclassified Alcanivorax TaxID=2638842 RepID=UPI0007B8A2A7|nr:MULTISPECIES: TetR/AcrR family transcriptional regulator [unclassified Alcanivorax]KZX73105.1 TetR family transcriptional regulator [Alcanivorax sp. HI0011]KZX83838.1 TetR family transcriptional regulator [Alcanivorax sp. HI0013]KZY15037.1 TetR family transcriptional regulator [Alcanivorax sp. HI0035]MEE3386900.1 TetR/AcrR family transcriptional regulator [Pseudomonadota bacterium]KZX65717.1 TetR family transcriptional regulator [Alcanivorax sp. HI0007]